MALPMNLFNQPMRPQQGYNPFAAITNLRQRQRPQPMQQPRPMQALPAQMPAQAGFNQMPQQGPQDLQARLIRQQQLGIQPQMPSQGQLQPMLEQINRLDGQFNQNPYAQQLMSLQQQIRQSPLMQQQEALGRQMAIEQQNLVAQSGLNPNDPAQSAQLGNILRQYEQNSPLVSQINALQSQRMSDPLMQQYNTVQGQMQSDPNILALNAQRAQLASQANQLSNQQGPQAMLGQAQQNFPGMGLGQAAQTGGLGGFMPQQGPQLGSSFTPSQSGAMRSTGMPPPQGFNMGPPPQGFTNMGPTSGLAGQQGLAQNLLGAGKALPGGFGTGGGI
jgi:hypothetical protein